MVTFTAAAVEVASCFVVVVVVFYSSFYCQLLAIGINSMLVFLLVIFMSNLFLFCVNRMLGMERSPFSHVMTTTMIRKAKI